MLLISGVWGMASMKITHLIVLDRPLAESSPDDYQASTFSIGQHIRSPGEQQGVHWKHLRVAQTWICTVFRLNCITHKHRSDGEFGAGSDVGAHWLVRISRTALKALSSGHALPLVLPHKPSLGSNGLLCSCAPITVGLCRSLLFDLIWGKRCGLGLAFGPGNRFSVGQVLMIFCAALRGLDTDFTSHSHVDYSRSTCSGVLQR